MICFFALEFILFHCTHIHSVKCEQDCLDNFKDQNEFYYVKNADGSTDDKWWIPTPKVPPNGLSETTRKWLQSQKDSVNQVLKASMAINAQVLTEMEIPESYVDTLPFHDRMGDQALETRSTRASRMNTLIRTFYFRLWTCHRSTKSLNSKIRLRHQ